MAQRKLLRRTPGARLSAHRKSKQTSKHKCGICKSILAGTPRGTASFISKLTKTQRRPTRPFGGQLCSKCTRKIMTLRARLRLKLIEDNDVPISLRNYIK